MNTEFTLTQKRALAVATIIAIVFGAYFLRGYFILIVVAAVAAYLFTPLFNRLNKRFGTGLSATLTLLAAIAAVIVPLGLFVALAVVQITTMVERVAEWVERTDLSTLGDQRAGRSSTTTLHRVPYIDVTVTPESLRSSMTKVAQEAGQWLLGLPQGAAGGLFGGVTAAILFLYVFLSLLTNRDKVLHAHPSAQPARRGDHRHVHGQDGRDGQGHRHGPVRHRRLSGCQRRGVDLHRGIPPGLLPVRSPAVRPVGHPAGQRHRDDSVRSRNDPVRQHFRRRVRDPVPHHRR